MARAKGGGLPQNPHESTPSHGEPGEHVVGPHSHVCWAQTPLNPQLSFVVQRHTPAVHPKPWQSFPQVSQFLGSERRSASQPSAREALQLPKPSSHTSIAHCRSTHAFLACASAQGRQSSAAQPLLGSSTDTHAPLQVFWPGAHDPGPGPASPSRRSAAGIPRMPLQAIAAQSVEHATSTTAARPVKENRRRVVTDTSMTCRRPRFTGGRT